MDSVVSLMQVDSLISSFVVTAIAVSAVVINYRVNIRLMRLLHGQTKSQGYYKLDKFFCSHGWSDVQSVLERLPQKTVHLLARVLTDKYCSLDNERQLRDDLHAEVPRLLTKFRVSWLVFVPVVMTSLLLVVLTAINLNQPASMIIFLVDLIMLLSLIANINIFLCLLSDFRALGNLRATLKRGEQALYGRLDL